MLKASLVLIGGGLGAIMRYAISLLFSEWTGGIFPYGTLFINLTGALLIGILAGVAEAVSVSPEARAFLQIGVLGGYTTFSSFGLETINLWRAGEMRSALIYVMLTNMAGLFFVVIGFQFTRRLLV